MQEVQKKYETHVITNSSTDHVAKELQKVGFPEERVIGNARKFVIDQEWNQMHEAVKIPGFPRPVMLRRKDYWNVLQKLGTSHRGTTVLGDIYEMDLALPDYLGMRIIKMSNSPELIHEDNYLKENPRGAVVTDLEEARNILFKLF